MIIFINPSAQVSMTSSGQPLHAASCFNMALPSNGDALRFTCASCSVTTEAACGSES